MSNTNTIHYYPVGTAIGYLLLGAFLLFGTASLLVVGLVSLWFILGFIMAIAAIALGIRSLTTRRKYPMTMGSEFLTFYHKGQEVRIQVQDLKRVWYNTSGIDKRVSLALANGSVIDIPVLYGLDELRKKVQERYGLPTK